MKLDLKESKEENISMTPFLKLRLSHIVDGKPVSQRKLAALMGNKFSPGHMSSLEKGRTPSLTELRTYHDYFGVSYDYLLGAENSIIKNDIFYDFCKWISTSPRKDEKDMWNTFLAMSTTPDGLVLLNYISKFLNDNLTEQQLVAILNNWKSIPEREYLSYQEIRQILENLQKE